MEIVSDICRFLGGMIIGGIISPLFIEFYMYRKDRKEKQNKTEDR